jgi:hypothetical protein
MSKRSQVATEQGAAMQVRAVSAATAIAVVALATAACNPTAKSKAAATVTSHIATPATTATTAATTATTAATPVTTTTKVTTAATAAGTATTSAAQPAASSAPPSASPSAAPSSSAAATPAPAAGGGAIDVCSLMTSAQASTINGVTYSTATPQRLGGIDACDYKNSGKHADEFNIQNLNVQVSSLPGCWTFELESQGAGVKVPGVGDDAFGFGEIGFAAKLGNRCIQLSGLTRAEFRDNYAPDAAMAKIIISKLS